VVKYRKPLLFKYGSDVKFKSKEISKKLHFIIDIIEVDSDHVHYLIRYPPTLSISKIVQHLKQETTHDIWVKYSYELKYQFWYKKIFWSDGYFVCSVGNASQEVIRSYIEEQG